MSRHTESGRDQINYLTYDERAVSREAIELAVRALETSERRRERMSQLRTWAITALIVVVLLGVCMSLLWWRLQHLV